jgi:hypothetical protein
MPVVDIVPNGQLSIKAKTKAGKLHTNNLAYQLGNLSCQKEIQNVVIRCANTIQFRTSKIVLSLASTFMKKIFLEMGCYIDPNVTLDIVSIILP